MIRTAILVDGGFYRKRALALWGTLSAEARAKELVSYCGEHLKKTDGKEYRHLYRIFYYDCEPLKRISVYHPLTKKNVELDKSETYKWTETFLNELRKRRKFAIRLGTLAARPNYNLKPEVTKNLLLGKRALEDLNEADFDFNAQQKGVDMKIGIDIASLAYKKQVDQIILISGDSDFVPAAKMARREGLDFILDPMKAPIKDDLFEHIDGLETPWKNKNNKKGNPENKSEKTLTKGNETTKS